MNWISIGLLGTAEAVPGGLVDNYQATTIRRICMIKITRKINANHQEFAVGDCLYLQSYSTIVVKWEPGQGMTLDPMWDCSVTTAKQVSRYLGVSSYEIRKSIENGTIKVEDLNHG